jgi:D-3-phosphoglycerate dehydrogenase
MEALSYNARSIMDILIPDDYQDAVRHLSCFPKLAGHDVTVFTDMVKDLEALAERLRPAEVLVLIRERTRITEALLDRLPRLKMISQTGKGTAHIDIAACSRRGILVSADTGSPYAPAELTWALVLAATRRIPYEVAQLRAGHWQSTLGTGLRGRTLGIWGYGKIGSLVAGYGRAFGMNVLAWGREGSLSRAQADGFPAAADRQSLFEQSDVLSLHLKLDGETRGIVTAADLARMKPEALIVNTSRAGLIEPGALVAALRAGRPGFAAVDVYEEEPILGADHPLLAMENAVCTPHLGYVEKDSYELYFGEAFDQVLAFAEGRPIRVVKP